MPPFQQSVSVIVSVGHEDTSVPDRGTTLRGLRHRHRALGPEARRLYHGPVDWGTLAGTALGALLGVSTTLLGERSRWHRENASRERAAKRQLYSEYLGALWLTKHRLRDLQRSAALTREERIKQSGEILGAANAFQLLYEMRIMAPNLSTT